MGAKRMGCAVSKDPEVYYDLDGHIAYIVLASVARRNALGASLVSALTDALCKAIADEVRVAVISSVENSPAWSSGFAIDELPEVPDGAWPHPLAELTALIRGVPFPVVAAVTGGAWGGGFELALSCDAIIAEEDAVFALTPARLGVAYDAQALDRIAERLPRHLAMGMIMTADPVHARRLHEVGVVWEVAHGHDGVRASARALAETTSARAPLTLAAAKAVFQGLDPQVIDQRAIQAWTSRDYREGAAAFKERRSANFRGQ